MDDDHSAKDAEAELPGLSRQQHVVRDAMATRHCNQNKNSFASVNHVL